MSQPPTYDQAIASLNGLIPELFIAPGLNGAPPTRRKFSLDQIRILAQALGNPQHTFPSVLIAGTNGKGSTAATLASIARASGLKTGLYTSPHLERVNERIRLLTPTGSPSKPPQESVEEGLDGVRILKGHDFGRADQTDQKLGALAPEASSSKQLTPNPASAILAFSDIPDPTFARLYFQVLDSAQQLVQEAALTHLPSYFELLTALAFLYFAEERIDLAVLEVGMGGRLDATNLVTPLLSVITDISLDHQEWLGNTIAEITREKAGILRPHGTLVTLPQHPEANHALGEAAVSLEVRAVPATPYMPASRTTQQSSEPYPIEVMGQEILIDSPLKGAHQHRNIALAIAAAIELNALLPTLNSPITPATIAQGIRTTTWPGRLERLRLSAASTGAHRLVEGYDFSRATKANDRYWASAPEESSSTPIIEFILDVAHNPAGAWALRSALSEPDDTDKTNFVSAEGVRPHGRCLIFACLKDKPLREMTQILFPLFDHVILAPIHSPRAIDMADLLAAALLTGTPTTPAQTVQQALQLAISLQPAQIVISGSVYLVGESRHLLLNPAESSIDSAAGDPLASNVPGQSR